jgi:hypothetical protein
MAEQLAYRFDIFAIGQHQAASAMAQIFRLKANSFQISLEAASVAYFRAPTLKATTGATS